jgi:hypothetical protein
MKEDKPGSNPVLRHHFVDDDGMSIPAFLTRALTPFMKR